MANKSLAMCQRGSKREGVGWTGRMCAEDRWMIERGEWHLHEILARKWGRLLV